MEVHASTDDSEDFKLNCKENRERFGSPITEQAIDKVICDRVPQKTQ